jgi:hypothetical protein
MNNDYILTLPSLLDEDYMKKVGKETLTEEWLSIGDVQALRKFTDTVTIDVESDPYLKSIRDTYPKLESYIKLLKMDKGQWPTHVDTQRSCAINIPIQNCDETKVTQMGKKGKLVKSIVTTFGDVEAEWHSHQYVQYVADAVVDFEFALQGPTLFNTKIPHGVINYTDTQRVIATWSYDDDFDNAKKDFLNG